MDDLYAVRSADQLFDAQFAARWQEREALDPEARTVLRAILEHFAAGGGPLPVAGIRARDPAGAAADLGAAAARLDDRDLILLQGGQVVLAYPLAGIPTDFVVIPADGRRLHACCALDALGLPAMLGEPVAIRSRCHHCGGPLDLRVGPEGPRGDAEVMVWVGERDARARACASL